MTYLFQLDISNSIVAPLIVAAVTGIVTWSFARWYQQSKIEAAPRQYVAHLDKLIKMGVKEGVERATVNARAIVAARNSMRSSLVTISSHLNSEIDRLAVEIGESSEPFGNLQRFTNLNNKSNPAEVYETIEVLAKVWSAKKTLIENEIRKMLAEIGIDIRTAKQSGKEDAA